MNDFHLVYLSNANRDFRIWSLSLDGWFSSKSFFTIFFEDHSSPSHFSSHKMWISIDLPWVKAFNWIASLGRQNTMDMLLRRHPYMALSPSVCCLCGKNEENGNHIFI